MWNCSGRYGQQYFDINMEVLTDEDERGVYVKSGDGDGEFDQFWPSEIRKCDVSYIHARVCY